MAWEKENIKFWRATLLVIGLVALMGPWTFDRVNVPAEYACSSPNVRLEGDFCGVALLGWMIFGGMVDGFVDASVRLLLGSVTFIDWGRTSLFSLLLFLLVLPLFSTLFLILRGDGRQRQMFSIVTWVLAAGTGLLLGLFRFPGQFWALWGLWLYIALAAIGMVLEVLALRAIFREER
jgi:4-amino-4-deoxy-L-arabinose transferase-like glycosyltransferase